MSNSLDTFNNSLDPDQARLKVGPDLGPACYKRLSAKVATSKERFKGL